jgi:opacity protein-like surface antigen
MKRLLALTLAFVLFSSLAFAAAVKNYQVTGPVLEVTDDMIAVKKGADRWEIARTPDTKVAGDLKVGSKVTIEYKMTATKVDVKEAAKKK